MKYYQQYSTRRRLLLLLLLLLVQVQLVQYDSMIRTIQIRFGVQATQAIRDLLLVEPLVEPRIEPASVRCHHSIHTVLLQTTTVIIGLVKNNVVDLVVLLVFEILVSTGTTLCRILVGSICFFATSINYVRVQLLQVLWYSTIPLYVTQRNNNHQVRHQEQRHGTNNNSSNHA